MSEIHGLASLLDMRKRGRRPAEQILLTVTDSEGQARYVTRYTDTEGVIRSSDNIETLDLRPLVGMDVIVCTTAKTDEECKALLAGFRFPFKN